jgi:hypothetical protein
VRKPERKRPVGRPNRRENNIKMDFEKYLGGGGRGRNAFIGKKVASSCEYINKSFGLQTKKDIT